MENLKSKFESSRVEIAQFIRKQTHKRFNEQFKIKFKKQYAQQNIYTVICSIGIIKKQNDEVKVIGIANGTKSLPYSVYSQNKTFLLKDMHAEILVIKSFRKFIAEQISKNESPYFKKDSVRNKKVFNKDLYEIFLYSSEQFCGDCSINEDQGLFSGAKPLKFFNCCRLPNQKFQKHILRTKPGRLDLPQSKRSLSLSCSDKLALYNIIGIQGKELFEKIKPIYIDFYVVECIQEKKKSIQQGLNFVYRLAKLRNQPQKIIERKIFNIVIDLKERKISNQFKLNTPQIFCIPKSQESYQKSNQNTIELNQNNKKKEKEGFQLSLICLNNFSEWINNKTGLPEGSSLNSFMKKGKISAFSKKRLLQFLYSQNIIMKSQLKQENCQESNKIEAKFNFFEQTFKYSAIKDRIKLLFGIWTEDFKTPNNQKVYQIQIKND